jgi:CHAT domain-containing protein
MDERKINAYTNLLMQILECSRDDEIDRLLEMRSDVFDRGFIEFLEMAGNLKIKQGEVHLGNLCLELASQLSLKLDRQSSQFREGDLDFLDKLIGVVKNRGNQSESIFRFLQQHLDRLDTHFVECLDLFADRKFPKYSADLREALAIVFHDLSHLLLQFPFGNRADIVEIAIACCDLTLRVYHRDSHPDEWAIVQNTLGLCFSDRIQGDRNRNIDRAIQCYQQALTIHTREQSLNNWTTLNINLASAYVAKPQGNISENFEKSIGHLKLVLQTIDRRNNLETWAFVQHNLGAIYIDRPLGNRLENMEAAIACCKAALSVYDRQKYTVEWGKVQQNLGIAYFKRNQGDRYINLELSIHYSNLALEIFSPQFFLGNWSKIKVNLARAYEDISQNKSDNLEKALNCIHEVFEHLSLNDAPEQWAEAQLELGRVYSQRIQGDLIENFERAIAAYQSALSVYKKELFPEKWASVQHALGYAYHEQLLTTRPQPIERAIEHYQQALLVYTPNTFPYMWACTHLNLANAYNLCKTGSIAENIELAIDYAREALKVYTQESFLLEWADLQNNLGQFYTRRMRGNRDSNIQKSFLYYKNALKVYNRQSFPLQWAKIILNFAHLLKELGKFQEAIAHLELALEVFTLDAFPYATSVCGHLLGNIAFDLGQWEKAIYGYELAVKGAEISRSWIKDDTRRQEILIRLFGNNPKIVEACIHHGDIEKAVEFLERSRSRFLADLMTSQKLLSSQYLSDEIKQYLQDYERLQEQIDRLYFFNDSQVERSAIAHFDLLANRSYSKIQEQIAKLEFEKQNIWKKFRRVDPVLAGELEIEPLQFDRIQALVNTRTTAILSFYVSEEDTYIFIVRKDKLTYQLCPNQGKKNLQQWLFKQWLEPYIASGDRTKSEEERKQWREQWQNEIPIVLTELSERLQIDRLIDEHLQGIEELILIPHLLLHQIPLGALPIADGGYFSDKFLIRYVPSCQILNYCQNRPPVINSMTYGMVENTQENLAFTNFECQYIAELFQIPNRFRLQGRQQGTVENFRELVAQVNAIHFSHHAESRLDRPLESKLELGDGYMTLGQLMTPGWRLPHLVEVSLSCCETGFTLTGITDDTLTFAAGFLCAGARHVVNTLWSVNDLSTALFSMFYYRDRHQGICRVAALQSAQEALRNLDSESLKTVYQPQMIALFDGQFKRLNEGRQTVKAKREASAVGSPEYEQWDAIYKQLSEKASLARRHKQKVQKAIAEMAEQPQPFSHPVYWAAFIGSGLR